MAMQTGQPIRVYADSSVYGGVFDEEFATASRLFFDRVTEGRFRLVLSSIVIDELAPAPDAVRTLLDEYSPNAELVQVGHAALTLQRAYLQAGILGPKWKADALHVALAAVSKCPIIVSWNFRHIVHFQKIPLYNKVNLASGFGELAIHTPQEVAFDED